MKILNSLIALLFVFVLFLSCKDDKGTDIDIVEYNDVVINLDKGIYQPEAAVHMRIFNNTPKDLILLNCGYDPGFDLQKNIVGKWNTVSVKDCPNVGLPFEILAGETKEFDFALPALTLKPDEIEGKYRLLLWLKDKASGQFLDQEDRATSSFRIQM